MAKIKTSGRPPGAMNKKNTQLRDCTLSIKCSQGLKEVLPGLQKALGKKSKADVIHEAVMQLVYRTELDDKYQYWGKRIQ